MKDQTPQDVVAQEVDANAVDALSAELAASIESQEDKSAELNALLDEKKEREEESVDVAAADDGLAAMILADTNAKGESIPAAEASTGGAAGVAGLSGTDAAIYAGVAALGVAGVIAASEDDDGDGVPADYVPPNTSGANGGAENIWTLQERIEITPGAEATPASEVVYWGYNPHDHESGTLGSEAPSDGGIPAADLVNFLQNITGLDLAELGLIDDDGAGPFDNVRDLSLSNVVGDSSTLTVTLADGTVTTAEAVISGEYFDFLNGLLFDEEGNSRLFVKTIDAQAAGDDLEKELGPIILTTAENNGGTIESGKPDDENDLVVAGRLELLHQAYIDAGDGYNVLEVDAKGVYAQPLALTNIQEVRVQNLPNFYTEQDSGSSDANINTYPDLADPQGEIDSVIDLSRAIDIEKLVVTEGYGSFDSNSFDLGALTLIGVRNGADLSLEGGFFEDVTVHYGQGLQDSLNVDLRVGDVDSSINILHNLAVINVNSLGIENNMDQFFAGGDISRMIITGPAVFGVEGDISNSFNTNRPAVIDASANTGGVDLVLTNSSQEAIDFTGSTTSDDVEFEAETVSIDGGDGDNQYDVSADRSTITNTGGNNSYELSISEVLNLTAGDGDNVVHAVDDGSLQTANITLGNGSNTVEVSSDVRDVLFPNPSQDSTTDTQSEVTVVAGNGGNDITARGDIVSVTTGTGNDEVTASGMEITVNASGGNDHVTIFGENSDFRGFSDKVTTEGDTIISDNALLNIDLGSGTNTLVLGVNEINDIYGGFVFTAGVTAMAGSVITGENITLFVNEASDLSNASLTGITSVVLDDDTDDGFFRTANANELTLTAEQFGALGADAFSVQFASEGASAALEILVSSDVTLGTLVDLTQLSDNICLKFVIANGATLTLTAEELHNYVGEDGISVAAGSNGTVVLNDAGQDFNAFTDDDGNGLTNGTLDGSFTAGDDLVINRSDDGFERPEPADPIDQLIVTNTSGTTVLEVGDIDLSSNGSQTDLILNGGGAFNFSSPVLLPDNFLLDFSDAAAVTNLTIGNFEAITEGAAPTGVEATPELWGQIIGNGLADQRIDIELSNVTGEGNGGADGSTVGYDDVVNGGFISSGVSTYVVTELNGGDSLIYVCDNTQDLEVLGLQMNSGAAVAFENINFGVELLLEGDGAADWTDQPKENGNPDFSNIGSFSAEYFTDGAPAVLTINNQGTALGLDSMGMARSIKAEAINVENAKSLAINVADGALIVDEFTADETNTIVVTSAFDVNIAVATDADLGDLDSLDATGVAGTFTLTIDGDSDLSGVDLTGVDAIVVIDDAELTLTTDQLLAIGFDNISTDGSATTLSVTDLNTQVLDLSLALTVSGFDNVGDVTLTDVAGTLTLDPATNLHSADSVEILAETSDTTVEMTAAQFNQIEGATPEVNATIDSDILTGLDYVAKLRITDLEADTVIDLADVDAAVVACVELNGFVAGDDFEIVNGTATLEVVSGDNDLTAGDISGVSAVVLTGGTLTISADQLTAIIGGGDIEDVFAGSTGGVLNISDYEGEAFDLDELEALGIDIGTITLEDTNGAIVVVGGATFGDADAIVTPTADVNDAIDGLEDTTFFLTVEQFLSTAGVISGDAETHLTDLVNNSDDDGDFTLDSAILDVSGITAPRGTVSLGEDTVALNAVTDLSGFEIVLANGQMIQFSTEVQASGTTVTEISGITAVAWLFDAVAGQVDTVNYDGNINTLFILEDLVDGANEEDLWTTLDSDITVEKVNVAGIPDVLIAFQRVNTFEALTGIAGVTYDDQDEFESVQMLTINMEGNTDIGTVLIADTVGEAAFTTLVVNSYEDRTTLEDDNGFPFQPNIIGDLTIANTADDDIDVTLNTGDFFDAEIVSEASATRDGLDLEVGVITFAAEAGNDVTLDINGDNDVTIGGLDISDADITLLTVDASDHSADLTVGGIAPAAGINDFDFIYVVDGHTAEAGDDLDGTAAAEDILLVVAGGSNDLKEASVADVDSVHFTADAELFLTAAQVAAIGIVDADADGIADNWSAAPGVTVSLHICDLGTEVLDLNLIQDAGINIGDITIIDGGAELAAGTTLGGADTVTVEVDAGNSLFELTATQYQQIDGTIEENLSADAVTNGFVASVTIDELETLEHAVTGDVEIDLTTVNTTGNHNLHLSESDGTPLAVPADGDVTLTATADLAGFAVNLNDVDSTGAANELFGETIRFATEAQAGRDVNVQGIDASPEDDSNVVWLFDATSGAVDTSGYDAGLGRLWLLDTLVDGNNVEGFYTTLDESIIVRIVNSADLADLLLASLGFDRTVEIEAFTQLAGGLSFNDEDIFEHVENLTITLGGQVLLGDNTVDGVGLFLDNIMAVAGDQTTDEFDTLTINSFLAEGGREYLYPESYVAGVDVPVSGGNVIGDIGSGTTRDNLANVIINATDVELSARRVIFADDDNTVLNPTATITLNGTFDVTLKALDVSDAEITSLVVNNNIVGGVYTVTGGSSSVSAATVEDITINTVAGSVANFGTATDTVNSVPYASFAGTDLSSLTITGDGEVNLGTIAIIDSSDDDTDADTIPDQAAFTLDAGTALVTATLGQANAEGVLVAPSLNADSQWIFDFHDAAPGSSLTITDAVTFAAGGTLTLDHVNLILEGDVDLSGVVLDFVHPGTTISVPAGSTLTLSVEQLEAADMIDVTGSGTVIVTGDASDIDTVGTHIKTVGADFSAVTIDTDADSVFTVVLTGAIDDAAAAAGQVVTGTPNDDSITTSAEDDTIDAGAGNDTVVAGDGVNSITGGAGDDDLTGGADADTFNVDEDTDTVNGLETDDVLVVAAAATADAVDVDDFVATAETVNEGTANITGSADTDSAIDLSLAGGSVGFNLNGGTGAATGNNTLEGSEQDDTINGGNLTQTAAGAVDTLTGNGGADTFVFDTSSSVPAELSTATLAPLPVDEELITITADDAAADNNESLTVNYTVDGVAATGLVVDLSAVDITDDAAIAAAVAFAFDARPSVSASSALAVVSATGDNGGSLTITSVVAGGTVTTLAGTPGVGTDVVQTERLSIDDTTNPVSVGETYTATVTLAEGQVIGGSYTAIGGDTAASVAIALAASFNGAAAATTVDAVAGPDGGGVDGITFTDEAADNGGFTLTFTSEGTFGGSGASNDAADLATADIITDFVSGEDTISFGLVAGSGTNYVEVAETVDFATARSDADTAFDGTVQYYLTSTAADEGILFFDANADGSVDGVVSLLGVDSDSFAFGDVGA